MKTALLTFIFIISGLWGISQVTITTASGGTNISADKALNAPGGGQFTTLGNVVISGNGLNYTSNQTNVTLILTAPANWKFNTLVAPTVTNNSGTGGKVSATSITNTATTITVTYTTGGFNLNTTTITILGIQVKADNGALVPASGNITRTGGTGTIFGFTNQNVGSLSQAAGAATSISIAAISNQQVSTAFPVTMTALDQFGNTATSFTGNANMTTTLGTIAPTTSGAFVAGVKTTNFTLNTLGTGRTITATSGALTGTSNAFAVVAAQAASDYFRSRASGNWATAATWERSANNVDFAQATAAPTTAANTVTVQNAHTVTVAADVSADQITVATGGILRITDGDDLTIANGTGTDLTVNGTVDNEGTIITSAGATTVFNANSFYQHDQANAGGAFPTATWNATSTASIEQWENSGNTPTNLLGQTFGNFTINNSSDGNATGILLTAAGTLNVAGNFTVSSTGDRPLALTNNTNGVLAVGGNFIMSNGFFGLVAGNGAGTANVTGNFTLSGGEFVSKDGAGAALLSITGNYAQSAGLFDQRASNTTSTSTVTVGGSFSLSGTAGGSIFDITGVGAAGVLNVAGDFSITGGTLTETSTGTATVNFNGTGVQTYTSGGTVSNAVNFIVKNGSSLQMAAAATAVTGAGTFILEANAFLGIKSTVGITTTGATGNIQVTGTRTYTTGALYEYNGTAAQVVGNGLTQNTPADLTIDNPTSVSLSANTVISRNLLIRAGSFSAVNGVSNFNFTLGGNWTNAGGTFTPGTGTVVMNGAALQTIGGAAVTTFNNVNLNKTTGTVSLTQSQNVNGTLNIGVNLDLGSSNLTMGASAGTIGTLGAGSFSATKMIVASGSGELRKLFGPATTTLYAFPIGDNTAGADYSPAAITFTTPSTSNGYVALKVVDAKHPNNGHVNSFLSRYWTVTQSGLTAFTAQVGFTYVDADINGTEANIRLGKWDGQGPWTRYGVGSMNNPLNSMLSDAVGTFSDFSGLDFLEILPVNFGKFRGWAPNTSVNTIEWEIFGETGVDKYEIEKLSSGDVFRSIGVQSPSNSGLDITYLYNDNAPNGGDNFYRIKATELTGEITYSPVVRVRNGGVTATAMKVYPNPATGSTVNISLQGIKAGKYEMMVSNNAGQVIYRSTTEQRAGNVIVQIPVSNTLPKGIYRVKVSNGENVMLSSFIKE